jgi:hypothetical protein
MWVLIIGGIIMGNEVDKYLASNIPKLATTVLGFAGPPGVLAGALGGVLLGAVLTSLKPSRSEPTVKQVALMAVSKLENYIRQELNEVEMIDASSKIQTAYQWFKETYDRAWVDSDAVSKIQERFITQLNDALGPNSQLTIGINKLSEPRYRYLGINMLVIGMGLRLTLRKIRMQIDKDLSAIPNIISEITRYIDVLKKAKREAEMYGLKQLQGLKGDAMIKHRDELVQQLYQGDQSVALTAKAEMGWMIYNYNQLQNA